MPTSEARERMAFKAAGTASSGEAAGAPNAAAMSTYSSGTAFALKAATWGSSTALHTPCGRL